MSPPITTPRIAIIGAGPVSLTLANILQKHNIPFSIYEASPLLRPFGGSLDLHPQSGQLALREAGLWDEFVKHARPESDVHKLIDIDGTVQYDENTTDKRETREGENKFAGRPEIDREELIELLYRGLKEGVVEFGRKLEKVVEGPGSSADVPKFDLCFADGTKESGFDLVVGGDGAWSKVRNFLTDEKPRYCGISMIELWANDISQNEWLKSFIGAGAMFSFGEGCGVLSLMQGTGGLCTYACLRVPQNFLDTCGIDWTDADTAKKELVARYMDHISDDLKRVIFESRDSLTPRTLFELPVGFTWEHRSGVTLIGDAAHLMSPFAGVGVNVGMADSLVLAREIMAACNGENTMDEALKAYEKDMYPRAEKNATMTERGKQNHFSDGGAKVMADHIKAELGKMTAGNSEYTVI